MSESIGINISGGNVASVKQIEASTKALMKVLNSSNDQKTKRAAMNFLKEAIVAPGPKEISISGVSIDMDNSTDDSLTINKGNDDE
ncbi:MAG: hypothetical protein [Bacteriophage sp.]|nr:MAG: hypothetical protein [Bacteriophage sp.]